MDYYFDIYLIFGYLKYIYKHLRHLTLKWTFLWVMKKFPHSLETTELRKDRDRCSTFIFINYLQFSVILYYRLIIIWMLC
jgi:hypothetical protein